MGLNTVAVLFNDKAHELEHDSHVGPRIAHAMMNWHHRGAHGLNGYFGYGQVVSCSHADYKQVVIVGGNSGCTIHEAKGLPYLTLDLMADCLKRHGWSASPPKKQRKSKKRGGE